MLTINNAPKLLSTKPFLNRSRNKMKKSHTPAAQSHQHSSGTPPPPPVETLDIHEAAKKFNWGHLDLSTPPDFSNDPKVQEIPVAAIRRPLGGVRTNSKNLNCLGVSHFLYSSSHHQPPPFVSSFLQIKKR